MRNPRACRPSGHRRQRDWALVAAARPARSNGRSRNWSGIGRDWDRRQRGQSTERPRAQGRNSLLRTPTRAQCGIGEPPSPCSFALGLGSTNVHKMADGLHRQSGPFECFDQAAEIAAACRWGRAATFTSDGASLATACRNNREIAATPMRMTIPPASSLTRIAHPGSLKVFASLAIFGQAALGSGKAIDCFAAITAPHFDTSKS